MRFLCLHGSGTSNKIFEAQTAALRYELGDHHTYEFVQGGVESPMAPELSPLSNSDGTYYAYFDSTSVSGYIAALDQLDAYLALEGPFDGLLAFSQGAGLAAMHIVRRAIEDSEAAAPFKCAILLSCTAVYDPTAWLQKGEIRSLDPAAHNGLIKIPTVHIWGKSDRFKDESEALTRLCDSNLATVYVHDGGHEVPGLGVKNATMSVVKAIRRGITQALLM